MLRRHYMDDIDSPSTPPGPPTILTVPVVTRASGFSDPGIPAGGNDTDTDTGLQRLQASSGGN